MSAPSHPPGSPNQHWIVAYDIPDDKRRRAVARHLEGVGTRRQRSVFQCALTSKELLALRSELAALADLTEDRIRYYPVCQVCRTESRGLGSTAPAHDDGYYVV